MEFVIYYGVGMTAVFVVFKAILFERSFRLKGIIYGILYCAAVPFYLFNTNFGRCIYSAKLFLSNGTIFHGSDIMLYSY